MQLFLFPTSGSEASHAKTSLLREWAKETGFEDASLASFMSLLDWLEKTAPEFLLSKTCRVSSAHTKEETSASFSPRWPNSGMLLDGVLLTAKTSESPSRASASTLSGVIETREAPQQYFLSPNAAKGMLRRAQQMGRPLFPPLRQSLDILAKQAP